MKANPVRRLTRTGVAFATAATFLVAVAQPAAAAVPNITSFSPTSGPVGTSVNIFGSNFTNPNATSVTFHNISASFTIVNDGQITATVPPTGTTGKIRVINADGTGESSATFVVTGTQAPTISSFTPTSGPVGTSVTINGDHFTGVNSVKFNGVGASFTFVSDNKLTATVPGGATDGKITVTTPSGTATSASNFNVTAGNAPTISSFSPSSGPVGTTVTINGTNFGGTTSVKFNGVNASGFTVNNAGTKITVKVPTGATTGRITVTTPTGTATSATNFTVTGVPEITSFSPTSGPRGTRVEIFGKRFQGTSSVRFNGVASSNFTVNASFTKITATVPNGATTGKISVTTSQGTAESAGVFTVTGGLRHQRNVTFNLHGHLIATGHVNASDGFNACEENVPVVIKRRVHGQWRWIETTATREDGSYRARIRDRQGLYRARARRLELVNGDICRGDRSGVEFHFH